MAIEIKVPEMGESIVEATVGAWVKNEGDQIEAGETILELETEKVNLEVTAPATGTLETVNIPEGEIVNVGTVLGTINTESIEKIQISKDEKLLIRVDVTHLPNSEQMGYLKDVYKFFSSKLGVGDSKILVVPSIITVESVEIE